MKGEIKLYFVYLYFQWRNVQCIFWRLRVIKPNEETGWGRNRYNFVVVNILLWHTKYDVMRSKSKWPAFLIHHAWFFVAAVLKLRLLLPKRSFTQTVCQKVWNSILSVSVTHEQRNESLRFSSVNTGSRLCLSVVAKPAVTLPLSRVWQLTCRNHIL
jgi:hypothetical protein